MILREIVHLVSFKVNEGTIATVESRVKQLGMVMNFIVSAPLVMLGKKFVEASFKMDTLALSVQTYSTNMEEANKVTEELKQLALALPTVKMEELGESVNVLLARGVAAKDIVSTFRTFAVITGATGGNMKGLVKAYTDVMSKGKLAGQEVNQFVNASVPLYAALSKSMGKSVAEIKIMQKDGKITFDVLKKALDDLAVSGGKFATIMEQKGDMLWGKWQKFQDQMFYLFAQLGKKLEKPLGILLDKFGQFIAFIKQLGSDWHRFIVIAMGVTAVLGPVITLWKYLKMFAGPLGIILSVATAISLIMDDIAVWMQGGDGDSILGRVFGKFEQYKPLIDALIKDVGAFFKSLGPLAQQFVLALRDLFVGLASGDVTKEIKNILDFMDKAVRLVTKLVEGFTKLIELGRGVMNEKDAPLTKPSYRTGGASGGWGSDAVEEGSYVARGMKKDLIRIAKTVFMHQPLREGGVPGWLSDLSKVNYFQAAGFKGVAQAQGAGGASVVTNTTVNVSTDASHFEPVIKKVLTERDTALVQNIKKNSGN